MSDKKVQISMSIKRDVAEKVALIAARSGRSRSNLCAWIVEQAMRKGDYED